jgi:hypothetical protein
MAELSLTVSQFPAPEVFNGQTCSACKDQIYGDGFRIVMMTQVAGKIVPAFKETEIKLCSSCKEFWTSDKCT